MNLLLSYLAISTCVILLRVFSYDFSSFLLSLYIYIYIQNLHSIINLLN